MRMALSSTRDVVIRDQNADKIKRYQSALLSYFQIREIMGKAIKDEKIAQEMWEHAQD